MAEWVRHDYLASWARQVRADGNAATISVFPAEDLRLCRGESVSFTRRIRTGSARPRACVTRSPPVRLLDSAGRPATFLLVTAAPLDCGAVSVWLVDGRRHALDKPLPTRGCSSAGRALHSHCRGQGFEPPQLHLLREFVGVVLALLRANSSIHCPPPFGRTESSNDGVCGNPRLCSRPCAR